MKDLKEQIRDVINYDSESTVALPFEVKVRLVNNITSTVEDYYEKVQHQKPDKTEGVEKMKIYEGSVIEHNKILTKWIKYFGSTIPDPLLLGAIINSMEAYHNQFATKEVSLPGDEEINKESIRRAITNTFFIREPERAWFEKGAKWMRSQIKAK